MKNFVLIIVLVVSFAGLSGKLWAEADNESAQKSPPACKTVSQFMADAPSYRLGTHPMAKGYIFAFVPSVDVVVVFKMQGSHGPCIINGTGTLITQPRAAKLIEFVFGGEGV